MHNEMWIPITMFIVIGVVFFTIAYFKYRSRQATQKTIRLALEKGNDLTPELLESLSEPKSSTSNDLRRGMISIAIGVGFSVFGFILDEDDAVRPLIGVGMFPIIIGIAYLTLWWLGGREQKN